MATIDWHGRTYTAENLGRRGICVARSGYEPVMCPDKQSAIDWLTCMSLRKGKARQLVETELNSQEFISSD